jgi:hypothetical protein
MFGIMKIIWNMVVAAPGNNVENRVAEFLNVVKINRKCRIHLTPHDPPLVFGDSKVCM